MTQKERLGEVEILLAEIKDADNNSLRELGDSLRDKLENGVVVLAGGKDGKVALIAMAADSAVKAGVHSGEIIKQIAPILGGGGGGKPQMAQAGGKFAEKIKEALAQAKEIIAAQLEKKHAK